MHIELLNQPGNTIAKIALLPNETVTTKGGTLLAMSPHLQVVTKDCLKPADDISRSTRRVIEGDRFIGNHYECTREDAELWLGNDLPGDMLLLEVGRQSLIVNRESFLAATATIEICPHHLPGPASWLKISGSGTLVLSAFGALSRIPVEREYQFVPGHIVAFNASLDTVWPGEDRSWRTRLLRSDNAYCRFSGRGNVWYQSHDPARFGAHLTCQPPASRSA